MVGLAGVIHDSRICFNLALHDDLDWVLKIMRSRSTCVKKVAEGVFGVSEDVVNWHTRIVVHYCVFSSFPKLPNLFRSIEVPNASPHLEGKLQGGGRPHHHDEAHRTPNIPLRSNVKPFRPSLHILTFQMRTKLLVLTTLAGSGGS